MLTAKQNMLEAIKGGNPDRFVNQFEAIYFLFHPFMMHSPSPAKGQENIVNAWGVTNSFPANVPGGFRTSPHCSELVLSPPNFSELLLTCPNFSELLRTARVAPDFSELIRTSQNVSELPRTSLNFSELLRAVRTSPNMADIPRTSPNVSELL